MRIDDLDLAHEIDRKSSTFPQTPKDSERKGEGMLA